MLLVRSLRSCAVLLCLSALAAPACSDGADAEHNRDPSIHDQREDAGPVDARSDDVPAEAGPLANNVDAGQLDSAINQADASTTRADGSTPTDGDASRCKRGVAYNNEKAADAPAFGKSITWWYNWSSSTSGAVLSALSTQGVEFVPMIWSGPPTRSIDTQALIKSIPQGAKYLLGFNEPNFGAQASLTPQQAAAAWPQLEEIARARNLKLVSPAVNYCGGNCNQTDPFEWLDDFFAACKSCQVDYVAFHWYACSIDALKGKVNDFATRYEKPLWLTEFACLDNPGDHSAAGQKKYMDEAVPFLESDARVFRYSWFIGRSSQASAIDLFAAPGALTALGSAYTGYPQSCR